jgi:hypothetical protein
MQSPFKLVPVSQIADIADKFTRSEILSSNELRAIVGFKPVDDPKADELRNSNLNESADAPPPASTNGDVGTSEERYEESQEGGGEIQEEPGVENSETEESQEPQLPQEILDFVNRFKKSK